MLLKSIRVYDADREQERQNKAALRYINQLREQRPGGVRVSGPDLFWFFAKLIGVALIVWGIVIGMLAL